MTDQELKDLVASLALDTKVMKAEADKRSAETERLFRESKAEADKRLDALGIANGSVNESHIVEIKSHLRNEVVDLLLEMMSKFRQLFPEYAGMKLYSLIAAAHATNSALEAARNAGFLF